MVCHEGESLCGIKKLSEYSCLVDPQCGEPGAPDEATIASIVAISSLVEKHGLNVEVTNFGSTGYVTTQETIALLRELQSGNVP